MVLAGYIAVEFAGITGSDTAMFIRREQVGVGAGICVFECVWGRGEGEGMRERWCKLGTSLWSWLVSYRNY